MHVKVIDPKGFFHNGQRLPKGEELDLGGAVLKAGLHFKQLEPVDGEAAPIQNPPAGKKPDATEQERKALAEKEAEAARELETNRAAFTAKRDARAAELKKLSRKEQLKALAALKLTVPDNAKEDALVAAILQAELGEEASALGL